MEKYEVDTENLEDCLDEEEENVGSNASMLNSVYHTNAKTNYLSKMNKKQNLGHIKQEVTRDTLNDSDFRSQGAENIKKSSNFNKKSQELSRNDIQPLNVVVESISPTTVAKKPVKMSEISQIKKERGNSNSFLIESSNISQKDRSVKTHYNNNLSEYDLCGESKQVISKLRKEKMDLKLKLSKVKQELVKANSENAQMKVQVAEMDAQTKKDTEYFLKQENEISRLQRLLEAVYNKVNSNNKKTGEIRILEGKAQIPKVANLLKHDEV